MDFVAHPGVKCQIGPTIFSVRADKGNPGAYAELHVDSPWGDGQGQDIQLGTDAQGRASIRIVMPPAGHPTAGGISVTVFEGPTQVYPAP